MDQRYLTCRKSDHLDDWYVIEWAEHDGREWEEPTGDDSWSLRLSARMGAADVEGPGQHMLALADAIDARRDCHERRCAVVWSGALGKLYSPRNSDGTRDPFHTSEVLDDLAAKIRAAVEATP